MTYFTFGSDHHPVRNAVVKINGTDDETARSIMIALHDTHWAFQYTDQEFENGYATRHPFTIVREVFIYDYTTTTDAR